LFHRFVHRFLSEVRETVSSGRAFGLAAAPPRPWALVEAAAPDADRARIWSLLAIPVSSLAPFFTSSALRSSRVTGLLSYYGLC
jgi:hypothetical protein